MAKVSSRLDTQGELADAVRAELKRSGIDLGDSAFATDDDVYKFYRKVMTIGPGFDFGDENPQPERDWSRRPIPEWKKELLRRKATAKENVEEKRKINEGWLALKKSWGDPDFRDMFNNQQTAHDIVFAHQDAVAEGGLTETHLMELQKNIHDALHRMQIYFVTTIMTIISAFFFFQMNTGVSPAAVYDRVMAEDDTSWQGPGLYNPNPINETRLDEIRREYYEDHGDDIKKFPWGTADQYNKDHAKYYENEQKGKMTFMGKGGYEEDGTYVQKRTTVNVDGYTF